ncbi:hypothetical protein [Streptomyces sp. NPDC008317]|uniref:hypothetical protein n=1 Tax=Streptomyces sp. NPDC008317 TaxID=3364827 RepID=UPI0036EBD2E9
MNPNGNPAPLVQARARISADKRQRALERGHQPVTPTAVARTAGVSTWLTYTDAIRPNIQAAQTRQATQPVPPPSPTSATGLRAELELARKEITQLRRERDQARTAVRHQLGRQLDALICRLVGQNPR